MDQLGRTAGGLHTPNCNKALDAFHGVLRLRLDHSKTWLRLGKILRQRERLSEAVFALRAAVSVPAEVESDHTRAWFELAQLLFDCGDFDEAALAYERVIERYPKCLEALHGLGDVRLRQDLLDDALELFQRALAIDPKRVASLLGVGSVFHRRGEFRRCEEICKQALSIDPNNQEAKVSFGVLLLRQGEFDRGWSLYECRRESDKHRKTEEEFQGSSEWTGQGLWGRSILVYAEQGFGDSLQFVRYLRLLKDQGASVFFRPPPALESLFRGNDLGAEMLPFDDRAERRFFDFFAPLASMPHRMGTDLSTIPCPAPYLFPDPTKLASYRKKFFGSPGLKVGIVWQGNPLHSLDAIRSVPLSKFQSLLQMKGIRVFSLQKGPGTEQLEAFGDSTVVDLGGTFGDFSDTAAAVANLDLVIAVDSAVAHLGGAMGVPTWILLPVVSDWRWFRQRGDSPWYQSVRLFRQSVPGDWDAVFQRVFADLRDLARENPRVSG